MNKGSEVQVAEEARWCDGTTLNGEKVAGAEAAEVGGPRLPLALKSVREGDKEGQRPMAGEAGSRADMGRRFQLEGRASLEADSTQGSLCTQSSLGGAQGTVEKEYGLGWKGSGLGSLSGCAE